MFSPASLELRPSRRQALGLVVLHAAALLSLYLCGLPWAFLFIASLLLGGHLLYVWRLTVSLTHPRALTAIDWSADGWRAYYANGRRLPVRAEATLISPQLTVVRLRGAPFGYGRDLLLHPDSAGEDGLRRLRVALKHRVSGATRISVESE